MRLIPSVALFFMLFASGVISISGSDDNTTTDKPTTSSLAPTTTSDIPTTSSEAPTTSSEAPTTTPKAPTTTSEAPTTTSEAPTTTAEPTTTSVPTTSEAPVTTVAPKPTPPPTSKGTWNVTCIIAELEVLFKIDINGEEKYIALSPNATSQGNCQLTNTTQAITLLETAPMTVLPLYELTLVFEKDAGKVSISNVSLNYNLPEHGDVARSDEKLFSVSLGNSYLCKSTDDVKLVPNVTMEIKYIHIQAFTEDHEDKFGSAESCKADDKVGDAVPIAVGCVLVALIVIVLIAYLVGRRRSRQRGYQSV